MQSTLTVAVPSRHEGVGLALRCAYLPRMSDMPEDFDELLDKLEEPDRSC